MNIPYRIGIGYDVHRWAESRELVLGGVKVPHSMGLLGHSDADVLTHAIMDALLGCLALGDIGKHFPDSDEKYRGARSVLLLEHVVRLVGEHGYVPSNVDTVLVAEQPRLSPHIESIRRSLAGYLGLPMECVSVKATTTEGLLYSANPGGMACYAVAMVLPKYQRDIA